MYTFMNLIFTPQAIRALFFVSALSFLTVLAAQQSVSGTVLDLLSGEALIGVNVQLQNAAGETVAGNSTDEDGRFRLSAAAGTYELLFSYIGYKSQQRSIEIPRRQGLDMGTISLRPDATQLEEVMVKEQAIRAEQQGDTTSYNADAYKTNPEASAQDLLEKMPGVNVQNGQVQAQGEQVRRVLVDGKPFFDNDVNAALRNLPAEMIQKIQVFDQESEQAQFTGFSSGETTKTINIVTKPGAKVGQFGKLYAGYGTDGRYQAGGSVNIFGGDRRISLIGQLNNVNQQNFSQEDLVGVLGSSGRGGRGGRGGGGGGADDFTVQQQKGIATTRAGGINFSDQWGKKMEVTASYFYNNSDNIASTALDRIFASEGFAPPTYQETNESRSENTNHRMSGRFDYKISDKQSILFRPRLSFQQNSGEEQLLGGTFRNNLAESETNNDFTSQLRGLNLDNSLLYRLRLPKDRRTISVNLSGGYQDNMGNNQQDYVYRVFDANNPQLDSLRQIGELDRGSYSYGTGLDYTEPLGRSGMLMMGYRYSFRRDDAATETFNFDEVSNEFSALNELQSNIFTSDYVTHETNVGYNLRTKIGFLMARLTAQWASLDNEQRFPFDNQVQQEFFSLQPMLIARIGERGSNSSLRFIYRSRAQSPSANQLQEVLDNSNPILLSIGNPDLKQSMAHNLFLRWNKVSEDKTKVLYGLLGGSFTNNFVGTATYLRPTNAAVFERVTLQPGSQLNVPVNLDGQYNLRGLFTYGLPVGFIKSNLNFTIESTLAQTPSLLNDEANKALSHTYGAGFTLSSNISEKVDFTISTRSSLNNTENSLRSNFNNSFFNQNSQMRLNIIFGPGLVFNSQVSHQYFDAFSEEFDQNFWLLNMSLGKQLFANQRGKIALSVFDALSQNNALEQNVTGAYIESLQSLVLQRYVMLTFSYQLRNFGQAAEKAPADSSQGGYWGGPPRM